MGLFFNRCYGDIENLNVITLGEARARAHAIEAARNSTSLKWLEQIAKDSRFPEARTLADMRAAKLRGRSPWARKRILREEAAGAAKAEAKRAEAQAARKAAEQTEGTPEYWASRGDYPACAACGPSAIPLLLEHYLRENATGRERIEAGLLSLGAPAYIAVKNYVSSLLSQFNSFTDGISSLDFRRDDDRQKAAIIEGSSGALSGGINLIGRFTDPGRAAYIDAFYNFVKANIYSDPDSAFSDMFKAVNIRRAAVRAMGNVKEAPLADQVMAFYAKALDDPSRFVRWEAVDILRRQSQPQQIDKRPALRAALEKALAREDDSVSNRKEKLGWLLGKNTRSGS